MGDKKKASLFKEMSSHLGIHGAERIVQQVDVCILIDGSEGTNAVFISLA